jgi:hypothetical protein
MRRTRDVVQGFKKGSDTLAADSGIKLKVAISALLTISNAQAQ